MVVLEIGWGIQGAFDRQCFLLVSSSTNKQMIALGIFLAFAHLIDLGILFILFLVD